MARRCTAGAIVLAIVVARLLVGASGGGVERRPTLQADVAHHRTPGRTLRTAARTAASARPLTAGDWLPTPVITVPPPPRLLVHLPPPPATPPVATLAAPVPGARAPPPA